jgi:hypothetical protein
MRGDARALLFGLALAGAPHSCEAKAHITVDLSSQTMSVDSASGSYSWPISSAMDGYVTPRGHYGVQSLQPMHYSKKYHNSPMPHSIFFNGGFAIHGTYDLRHLGQPASHGCVRISPANAATLFSLVRQEGAIIEIVGDTPTVARADIKISQVDVGHIDASPVVASRADARKTGRRVPAARPGREPTQAPFRGLFGGLFGR